MSRREHDPGWNVADHKLFAIGKQPVPLATVGTEIRPVIDALPELLDLCDLFADCSARAGLALEVLSR
jgi:hypothetical protein